MKSIWGNIATLELQQTSFKKLVNKAYISYFAVWITPRSKKHSNFQYEYLREIKATFEQTLTDQSGTEIG